MDTAFTSTKSLDAGNRLTILKLQKQLVTAQQELSSGRKADIGLALGGRTSETVSLRAQYARYTTLQSTNSFVSTRLDVTQTTLASFTATAQKFIGTLIGARDTEGGATVAAGEAKADLTALIDGLNNTVGGEYLFAGINNTVKPVTDYYATAGSPGRTAVANAFTTAFGTAQSDPANDAITDTAMQNFLDTTFSALFDDPSWSTDWSSASSTNLTSRISPTETVESSANASEQAFRKLAKAYTMVADLGTENLNRAAFQTVADTASRLAGEAVQDLATIQARLGVSAARVESSNTRMAAQVNILNTQIDNLEQVDPYEASTRVTTLMTQLETAYSLTARVQRLTILNYL
jgi:flagellar hook-associated protein 3 FlgL